MKQESEPGRKLGGWGCLQGLLGHRAAAGAAPSWSPCPLGSQRSPPSDPMPLHNCTPGDDSCPFTCVCLYRDLAMISYTQPVISNSTELSQTHLATKSYMTWTQLVAEFTRIDMKQTTILFIPSRVDIIFHRNHPDFIERVLPQTPPRVWPNI